MSTTETIAAPRHASLRDASQRSATHRDDARSTGLATNDVRERYLARQQRYNRSEKGRARYARWNAIRQERYASDPRYRLKIAQKNTLDVARAALQRSIARAEELWL